MDLERISAELAMISRLVVSSREDIAVRGLVLEQMKSWSPGFSNRMQRNQSIGNIKVRSSWSGGQRYTVTTHWDAYGDEPGGSAEWKIFINEEIKTDSLS